MEKAKMCSKDYHYTNILKLRDIFPDLVAESKNEKGETILSVNLKGLKEYFGEFSDNKEKFGIVWPDKSKSFLLSNSKTSSTLRPDIKKSLNYDSAKNVYIEGDNLEVLKVLREVYLHYFDVIYIDPPYNTGNNLIYKNDYSKSLKEYLIDSGQCSENKEMLVKNAATNGRFHSDWLNMIYPRLRVAKDLLSDKGILVLTIDDYEIDTITMVLNEIFGQENHLATIIIKNNPSGRSTVTGASIAHEYALFYSAKPGTELGRLQRNDKQISRYKESDENGFFEWVNFRKHGGYKEECPKMFYPIYIKKDLSSFRIPNLNWNNERKEFDILEEPNEDEIVSLPFDEDGRARRWKWGLERAKLESSDMSVRKDRAGEPSIYIKSRMNEEGMLPLTVWDDKKYSSTEYGTNLLTNILGGKYFDYPKSLYAVIDCLIVAGCKKDSKILDFFSGSATTAQAVMEMNSVDGGNRTFVMVQYPEKCDKDSDAYKNGFETICDIGRKRIELSAKNYKSDDFGFRTFCLDSTNMNDIYYSPNLIQQNLLEATINSVKPDRTELDLLFQVMLECGALLSSDIKKLVFKNKNIWVVSDNFIVACFNNEVDDDVVKEMAKLKPIYACFRDSGFSDDSANINAEQIFKTYSPNTERIKVI